MLSKSAIVKLFLALAVLAPASAAPANDNKPCPPANANSHAQGAPWCRTTTVATPSATSIASSVPEPTTSTVPEPTTSSTPSVPSTGERKRCPVKALGGDADDAPAINRAFEECSQGGVVAFEHGVRYNAYTPVSALKLNGTKVEFYGNVHLPEDIPTVQAIVADPKVYSGYWFKFKGEGLEWEGTRDISAGWIDSHGQAWWDANPAGQGGLPNRPHLLRFDLKKSSIMHLKSEKPIGWNTRIVADDLYIGGTVVNAHSKSGAFPFNTDGLGLSGTNILAEDSKIDNGDDCFAITTPSRNITMRKATCGGPGTHGLSIGSLGKNQAQYNTVQDITFEDITMIDALYGARFKSWVGGQGITENVKYHDIRLYNVTYPIAVTQTYVDQNNPGGDRVNNGSVILKNFSFKDWVGDINSFQGGDGSCISDPCWYEQDLPPFTGSQGVFFSCANEGSCQGFETENIRIYGQNGEPAEFLCKNVDAVSNPNLGFTCANNL